MPSPKFLFILCKAIGFGLLFLGWFGSGGAAGFIPIMALGIMTVLRHRLPGWWLTIAIDGFVLFVLGEYLALSVFLVSEVFYRAWKKERQHGLKMRDMEAGRYYELEQLQGDLLTAAAQIERMSAISERARISREIHDNAGHEIVGAYISLQTIRELLEPPRPHLDEALELYDTALKRLDSGVNKIREAVHNLAPITALGVETLRETCGRFPVCEVEFNAFGDMSAVPMYCWNLLESCLNESLTNIVRHAHAKQVKVDLDATPNIIRLSVENDGTRLATPSMLSAPTASHTYAPKPGAGTRGIGMGLRNLRHRAAAVGGNISVEAGDVFRVICVVPLM